MDNLGKLSPLTPATPQEVQRRWLSVEAGVDDPAAGGARSASRTAVQWRTASGAVARTPASGSSVRPAIRRAGSGLSPRGGAYSANGSSWA